ncbi:restriction endonuclease subunit S [Streptococcus sp. VTCC 12886]
MKDSGIEWIGEVPEEWEIVRLKDCLEINNGKDYKDIETDETGYPVIGSGGQFAYARKYLHDGTAILLGRKGTIDKPLYIEGKFWTVDTMFYGVPKSGIHAKFIYYVALQIPFGLYSTNTALPSMTQTDLQNHHFVMPPLDEQTQIADFLDKKVAQLDKVKSLLEEQIKTLEDYRQSLIYETVTKGLDKTVALKDSGVNWIGQIPEGWGVKPIKYLVSTPVTDGPHETPTLYDEGIPFLSAESVKNGILDFRYKRGYISETAHKIFSRKVSPQKNDIFIVKSGATTGNVGIVNTDEIFDIWSPLALVRTRSDLANQKFIYYFMLSDAFTKQIQNKWSFGTQQNIGMGVIEKIKLVVPPLGEQTPIADFLDKKSEQINQMIAIKKEQIENINKQRQTLIYDYVTGKRRI